MSEGDKVIVVKCTKCGADFTEEYVNARIGALISCPNCGHLYERGSLFPPYHMASYLPYRSPFRLQIDGFIEEEQPQLTKINTILESL